MLSQHVIDIRVGDRDWNQSDRKVKTRINVPSSNGRKPDGQRGNRYEAVSYCISCYSATLDWIRLCRDADLSQFRKFLTQTSCYNLICRADLLRFVSLTHLSCSHLILSDGCRWQHVHQTQKECLIRQGMLRPMSS